MPLIKYMQYITLPDGSPAAEMAFPVRWLGGNVLIPTFSDKAGTTPLANPVLTDLDGLLTFYAAPGSFSVDVAGNVFHFDVDPVDVDEAWPGTFIHEQTTPSSVWNVAHHFGVEPSVTVLVGGQVTEASVTHPDDEATVITFSTPTGGVAYLRK